MSRERFDLAIIGAGTAGMAATIAAAPRGLRIAVIEKDLRVGGTLHFSSGQMSAAGTKLQRARGIIDTPEAHFEDIMRISRRTAHAGLVRRAVELAPRTIDMLMELGFDMHPACPALLHLHEAYRVPRTYWGVDGGRTIFKTIAPVFEEAVARSNVTLHTAMRVVSLLQSEGGAVDGVRVRSADGRVDEIHAREIVLTTGGYGASPELFARLHGGAPLYTTASPTSDGSGMEFAERLGARLRNAAFWKPAMAGIEDPAGSGRVVWEDVPALTPQARQPWEIFVDARGRRFVAEDHESVDVREAALAKLPGLVFWVVFDKDILDAAPALLPRFSRERLDAALTGHPSFVRAETLAATAVRAGIDVTGLARTVDDYNRAVASGRDTLGRRHLPRPIETPPFHAIRCVGMVLRTSAGVTIDEELRVLDAGNRPIPGLRAAGEIIGGGTLSGDGYVGGMSVTPALGFGRWLGETLGC